jgi:hypothetical protein
MAAAPFVQFKNPKTKQYVKYNCTTRRFAGTQDKPFAGVPIKATKRKRATKRTK